MSIYPIFVKLTNYSESNEGRFVSRGEIVELSEEEGEAERANVKEYAPGCQCENCRNAREREKEREQNGRE